MNTAAKERVFGSLFFVSTEHGRHGRFEHTNAPLHKRFQFREDKEDPLPSLENIRCRAGFNLWLVGTWSDNMEKGIGYDPEEHVFALTPNGIKEGSLGEFAAQGLHILEVGIRNIRPIPDVDKVSLELKYRIPIKYNQGGTRVRTGFRVTGSLSNLGISQESPEAGLITVEEVAGIKKETATYAGQKYTPRIPGAIESWTSNGRGPLQHVMAPANQAVLGALRASLRVLYR